jgi:hypothetical protein
MPHSKDIVELAMSDIEIRVLKYEPHTLCRAEQFDARSICSDNHDRSILSELSDGSQPKFRLPALVEATPEFETILHDD